MLYSVVVTGDHFQIFVADGKLGPTVDTSHLWDSLVGVASIPDAPQLIAIPTVRYGGAINVEVEILPDAQSTEQMASWARIGEFDIEVESGQLQFWGPEADNLESAPSITIEAATYHGVAYSHGTTEIEDELAMEGPDRYRICMWKRS